MTSNKQQAIDLMVNDGLGTREIAERLGISSRQASRLTRGVNPRARRQKDAKFKRADELLDDGVPVTYISYETGLSYESLYHHARYGDKSEVLQENTQEWRRTWSGIRWHPELVKLHREICGPTWQSQRGLRPEERYRYPEVMT